MTDHEMPDYSQYMNRRYIADLAERVAWTFVQTFLATLVASGWFTVDGALDLSIVEKAAVAGLAATLSLVKGLVARGVGSPYTAATLNTSEDTPHA